MIRLSLLLLSLLTWGVTHAQGDPRRIADAEAELRQVQARIKDVTSQLSDDRNAQDGLQAGLEALEKNIAQAQAALRKLADDLKAQQAQVQATQVEQAAVSASLQRERAALGQQIRAAFVMGDRAATRLVLNQDDALRLSRVMTYFDFLNRARATRIRSIDAQAQQLDAVERRLAEERASLEALRAQQSQALAQLEATRKDRGDAIAQIEARIRDSGQALRQLQRDERQVETLLESLRDILSDIPLNIGNTRPFAQSRGRLVRPVSGRALAQFGQAKAGTSLTWKGQWIAARTGTPVQAAAAGRVAHVGWMHRLGLIVILEHDSDYFTLYGHSESADVRLGQWVQAGQRIASAGSSGGHRESGVYFEIRRGKTAIDPRPWLSK